MFHAVLQSSLQRRTFELWQDAQHQLRSGAWPQELQPGGCPTPGRMRHVVRGMRLSAEALQIPRRAMCFGIAHNIPGPELRSIYQGRLVCTSTSNF